VTAAGDANGCACSRSNTVPVTPAHSLFFDRFGGCAQFARERYGATAGGSNRRCFRRPCLIGGDDSDIASLCFKLLQARIHGLDLSSHSLNLCVSGSSLVRVHARHGCGENAATVRLRVAVNRAECFISESYPTTDWVTVLLGSDSGVSPWILEPISMHSAFGACLLA
jgi:hypothetical protein